MKNILIALFGLLYCSASILTAGWFMQYVYTGYTAMNFAVCVVGFINTFVGFIVVVYAHPYMRM